MNVLNWKLRLLPCLDSVEIAEALRRELAISPEAATMLGKSAIEATRNGHYIASEGRQVQWSSLVESAIAGKISIAPDDPLPNPDRTTYLETRVEVSNETTLMASRRLVDEGSKPLALNFANGVQPGGGFLWGARAQEEVLCRSSALFATLVDDRMYECHWDRDLPDSTNWAIYSPDVPIFRDDAGLELDRPWLLSFITCAAPYAPDVGSDRAAFLLQDRIDRVLAIALAYGYSSLVLGAWGCGAFGNAPHRTAIDFRNALETKFRGAFSEIVFAITDWSSDRRTLGPFRDVFAN